MPTPLLAPIRPFTKRFINPLIRPVAGHLPGFAIVIHRGRKTGRINRAPMNVFRRDGDYVFALTYGSNVDWVRNVLDAGGVRLQVRGKTVELTDPELITDPTRHLMPLPVRFFLRLMRVDAFLRMRPTEPRRVTEADPA
jgi:deazaflavin-dependent oxidoreductase (nitroreductase family)